MSEQENTKIAPRDKKYRLRDGQIEDEDGKLVKSKMFDIFERDLDDYGDLEFTLEEIRRIRMHAMKMKTGVQAMAPALCPGPVKCAFSNRCPLVDRTKLTPDGKIDMHAQDLKKFPFMRMCIVEKDFLEFKRRQYAEEFDVEPESPTEMGVINKLAQLDLYEYRVTLVLSHGDAEGDGIDLLKNQIAGFNEDGNAVTSLTIHPAWNLLEKIHKQRKDLLESMVATRKEQYKQAAALKEKDTVDLASRSSRLREKVEQLMASGVLDADDIIDAELVEEKDKDKGADD